MGASKRLDVQLSWRSCALGNRASRLRAVLLFYLFPIFLGKDGVYRYLTHYAAWYW